MAQLLKEISKNQRLLGNRILLKKLPRFLLLLHSLFPLGNNFPCSSKALLQKLFQRFDRTIGFNLRCATFESNSTDVHSSIASNQIRRANLRKIFGKVHRKILNRMTNNRPLISKSFGLTSGILCSRTFVFRNKNRRLCRQLFALLLSRSYLLPSGRSIV